MNKKTIILVVIALILIGGYVYAKRGDKSSTLDQTSTSVTGPGDPNNSNVSKYPDNPVNPAPTAAITVRYLIEHRTALNNKVVTVKGVVVVDWTDASKCNQYTELLCPQPIIYIADSSSLSRDPYSDLRVVLNEDDKSYKLGQTVQIRGAVNYDSGAVTLVKIY